MRKQLKIIPLCPVPLWFRLSADSQYALKLAQSHNHHRKLYPPAPSSGIEAPDELAKIMQAAPLDSEHLKL